MKLSEIKQEMLEFRDFYGGDLLGMGEIQKAKTKKTAFRNFRPAHKSYGRYVE